MRTSAEQVPSLHRVAPTFLKLVTSSNFWPFVLISALEQIVDKKRNMLLLHCYVVLRNSIFG